MSSRVDLVKLLKPAAFVIAAYLYGSLPFVDYLARLRGVDLRVTGTRTIGGSNLWQQAGPLPGAAGWLLDASKGALPVTLGHRLGLSRLVYSIGATAGVCGQCWPVFLKFDGGRGVSAILGAAAMLAPRELAAMLIPMVGGCSLRAAPLLLGRSEEGRSGGCLRLHGQHSKAVPLSVGLSIAGIPLLSALRRRSSEIVLGTAANAVLLLARRATATPEKPERCADPTSLLISRLLYDRSTP